MLPISTHSTQNKNSKSAACHCLAYGAFDYWCCTARVPCDVFRFNRSGLVCALHMGPRADISIYDIYICTWSPARRYMSNLRLYLAETSLLARLNCLNCLNRLNCPALVPCLLTWSVLVILRTGDRCSNHVTRLRMLNIIRRWKKCKYIVCGSNIVDNVH